MTQFNSDPTREDDKYALPDCEVFYIDEKERATHASYGNDPGEPGWYYWYRFPGCLPDSDPIGPYDTAQEAVDAARMDYIDENWGPDPLGDWHGRNE